MAAAGSLAGKNNNEGRPVRTASALALTDLGAGLLLSASAQQHPLLGPAAALVAPRLSRAQDATADGPTVVADQNLVERKTRRSSTAKVVRRMS
jgi:hypothetical protein